MKGKHKDLGLTYPSKEYVIKSALTAAAAMAAISSLIFMIDTFSMYLFSMM